MYPLLNEAVDPMFLSSVPGKLQNIHLMINKNLRKEFKTVVQFMISYMDQKGMDNMAILSRFEIMIRYPKTTQDEFTYSEVVIPKYLVREFYSLYKRIMYLTNAIDINYFNEDAEDYMIKFAETQIEYFYKRFNSRVW